MEPVCPFQLLSYFLRISTFTKDARLLQQVQLVHFLTAGRVAQRFNLPATPDVLAQEIAADLEVALV